MEYAAVARNLVIDHHLSCALQALNNAGVPVIVLKGAALATTVYPGIGHRPMGDIDLLVHPQDRDRACAALEAAGYRFQPEPWARFHPFDAGFTGEMAFRRDGGVPIELHWQLTPGEWIQRIADVETEALWQAAQSLDFDGVRALQLSPPDSLIHLCLHLMAHSYVHMVGYRDITLLLNHYQPFEWDVFLDRVARFRLRGACYFALEAAASVQGAPVPQKVLNALCPPAWQRWVVRRIADPHRALAGSLVYSKPRGYLLHLAVADHPTDVLRVMLWLLFPGRCWLVERYRLHGWVSLWLACLWHPWIVMWQGLLGLRDLFKHGQEVK
jgi:hypothetical protein